MDSYISYFGAAGSIASMVATLYFWLVRVKREQPCLKPHLIDKEFFLGNSRDGVRQIGVKVGILVANYSVLPNAILGARVWVRLKKGSQEVGQLTFDKATPQTFNIPPMQTVLLRLNGMLSFPYEDRLETGSNATANYVNEFLMQPLRLKLELRHLNDHADRHVLSWPEDKSRTDEQRSAA